MPFKPLTSINILSPYSFYYPPEYLEALKLHCDILPQALPEKWGWTEPLKKVFHPDRLEEFVHPNGRCETMSWSRVHAPKIYGSIRTRWESAVPELEDTHAMIHLNGGPKTLPQDQLVSFLKRNSTAFKADFGLLDTLTPEYRSFAIQSQSAEYGDRFFIVTHLLRHWLPDIFWGTIFGPPYVALFGKERLLNAPVFHAEEIAENQIYLQLTETLAEVLTDPDKIQNARQSVKQHLAVGAFFDPKRAYDFSHTPSTTQVFKTPKFELTPPTLC